jgi:hypothetical protein
MIPFVLDKIIAAQGTTVEDEALRHGRRKAEHRTWESVHQRAGPLVMSRRMATHQIENQWESMGISRIVCNSTPISASTTLRKVQITIKKNRVQPFTISPSITKE